MDLRHFRGFLFHQCLGRSADALFELCDAVLRQGEGLGSLVLGPVLERCDEEGIPAYTETSARRNSGFYRRHGFGVVGELKVPDGGPLVWLMRRNPR
jgi:hypothetical protein